MTVLLLCSLRRVALSLVAAVLALLPLGCGGAGAQRQGSPPPPAGVLVGDVADAGDHAGTITAFENRLARLSSSDALYAPTLERLALAHLEYADALVERDAAQSRAQREQAVARFAQLTEAAPGYEGVPSALFLMAGEQQSLGDEAGARASLEQLVARHGATDYALQARLVLADAALAAGETARGAGLLDEVVAVPEAAAELAVYARYRRAQLHLEAGEPEPALELLGQILRIPEVPAALARQVRDQVVAAMATLPAAADAAEALRPYAGDDPAELERMVRELEALRAAQ